jgi:hypothetical protein
MDSASPYMLISSPAAQQQRDFCSLERIGTAGAVIVRSQTASMLGQTRFMHLNRALFDQDPDTTKEKEQWRRNPIIVLA